MFSFNTTKEFMLKWIQGECCFLLSFGFGLKFCIGSIYTTEKSLFELVWTVREFILKARIRYVITKGEGGTSPACCPLFGPKNGVLKEFLRARLTWLQSSYECAVMSILTKKGNLFFSIILREYIMSEEFKRWLMLMHFCQPDSWAFLLPTKSFLPSTGRIKTISECFFSFLLLNKKMIILWSYFLFPTHAAHFYSDAHFVVFSAEKLIQRRFVFLKEATCVYVLKFRTL